MSASPLSLFGSPSRSLEWLASPGALLSSTALTTGELGSLGPIASIIEGAVDSGTGESGSSLLPDSLAETANQIVLGAHAQIETLGHDILPLNAPLHGLTNLGETLGLGHLGESGNLLTDLGGVVANPTDTGSAAPVLTDAGNVATAANTLVDAVTAAPEVDHGLLGSGGMLQPAETILNQAVASTNNTLATVGHDIPVLNAPINGVAGLGVAAGLGHLGESGTLLTDISTLPGSLLNGGGLASATPVLTDLGHVLGSADTLVGSLTGLGNGLLATDSPLATVTDIANSAVLNLHTTLEVVGHEIMPLNAAIHGLTNLGETVGLGHLGESGNLLTDTVNLPGHLLGGEGLSALAPILGDTGAVAGAAGGLVGSVVGLADGLGSLGTPVGGAGGLLGGVTNLPGTITDGALPLGQVVSELGHGSDAVSGVVGTVTGALGNAGSLGQVLSDAGHGTDIVSGVVGTVTGVLGNAGSGGAANPLGSVLGGLTGGDTAGSHSLVDVAAGPATPTPAADVAVLSPGSDGSHTVQASAGTVPADQPSLLHTALLTGDSIAFPQTGGGADSLVGQLHDLVPVATTAPAEAGTSHDATVDLGLLSVDLGGHAQTGQADHTSHSATAVTHLLGL